MNQTAAEAEHADFLSRQKLIVVTPVFEDAEASSMLFRDLREEYGPELCIVAVDDGSLNQPLDADSLGDAAVDGIVVKLRRNVGHQRAIATGLSYIAPHVAPEAAVVIMDSDGEDTPATVRELLGALEQDDVDVVLASRKSRVETLGFKVFYAIYKLVFWLLTGRPISFGNFMALKQRAAQRLVVMQETWIHVAGAVIASRLRSVNIPLDRGPRYAGRSKMNFVGLVLHGFKALMVFAEDVLVRVGIACVLVAVMAILGAITAIGLKMAGFSTPGWFSVALGILVLIFMQTGALALMTLMLTGVVRGGTINNSALHDEFIDRVIRSSHGQPG